MRHIKAVVVGAVSAVLLVGVGCKSSGNSDTQQGGANTTQQDTLGSGTTGGGTGGSGSSTDMGGTGSSGSTGGDTRGVDARAPGSSGSSTSNTPENSSTSGSGSDTQR